MVKKETKEFVFRVAFYTLMITSLIIFCVLYDFNVVKEFISNSKLLNFTYDIQCKLRELTGGKIEPVFNAVQRCFRGTGELPNNKDLAYYNGANRVWKHIEDHIDDIELFDQLFLSGKIDYQNEQQEQISYEARTKGI